MQRLTVGAAALAICPVATARTAQRSHRDLAGQDGRLTSVTAGSDLAVDRLPVANRPLDRAMVDDRVIGNLRRPYLGTPHLGLDLIRGFAYVTAQCIGAEIVRRDPSGDDSRRDNLMSDVLSLASTIACLDEDRERDDRRIGTAFE